jgi:hypothetical protein
MRQSLALAVAALIVWGAPAPASAQASSFTLVNNTDVSFTQMMVRRFGTNQWLPLTVSPVPVPSSGGRGGVEFSNPDCAFDLQATLPDGRAVVWSGVNLCEAKIVTLNRGAGGELWVDYR